MQNIVNYELIFISTDINIVSRLLVVGEYD